MSKEEVLWPGGRGPGLAQPLSKKPWGLQPPWASGSSTTAWKLPCLLCLPPQGYENMTQEQMGQFSENFKDHARGIIFIVFVVTDIVELSYS